MSFRRCVLRPTALLAALALAVTGCAAGDAGDSITQPPPQNASAVRQVEPLDVPGVQPCSRLPMRTSVGQAAGERLPNLSLPCLTGGPTVNLADLSGRPVVINLWATWCAPCREEMPLLQQAHTRYGDRVAFLGVDTKDDPRRAGAFLQEVGVTYPQVVDIDGELLSYTRTPGLPVTIVLEADGQVSGRHVGQLTKERLSELVEDVTP